MSFRLLALILSILAGAGFLISGAIHALNLINPSAGWPSCAPREVLTYGLFPLYGFAVLLGWRLLKRRESDPSEGRGSFAGGLKDVGWPFWLAIALFGYATIMGVVTGDMIAAGWTIRPVQPMSARLEAASLMPFYVIGLGVFYTCYRAAPRDPAEPDRNPGGGSAQCDHEG